MTPQVKVFIGATAQDDCNDFLETLQPGQLIQVQPLFNTSTFLIEFVVTVQESTP